MFWMKKLYLQCVTTRLALNLEEALGLDLGAAGIESVSALSVFLYYFSSKVTNISKSQPIKLR